MNNPVYTLFEQYEIDRGLYSMDIDFTLTGQRIREARQYRGWTADVLAEKVGSYPFVIAGSSNVNVTPSITISAFTSPAPIEFAPVA